MITLINSKEPSAINHLLVAQQYKGGRTLLNNLVSDGDLSSFAALIEIADPKVIEQVLNLEEALQWVVELENWNVVAVLLECRPKMDAKIFVNIMTLSNPECRVRCCQKDISLIGILNQDDLAKVLHTIACNRPQDLISLIDNLNPEVLIEV